MTSKDEILTKVYNLAFKYEAERGSCPQCVLAALYETLGIGDPKTIQASDAFAGGSSLSTEGTCGALAGGLLVIGSVVGRTYKNFSTGVLKRRVFQYSKKLYDKFIEEYGSPRCKDIHMQIFGRTFNFWNPQDYAEFEKAGGHVDKCTVVSGNTAKWAAKILIDDLKIKF